MEAHALIGLGNAKIDPVENFFQAAIDIGKQIKNRHIQSQGFNGLGNYLSSKGNNEEALECYQQALGFTPPATDFAKKVQKNIKRVEKFIAEKEGGRSHRTAERRSRERSSERAERSEKKAKTGRSLTRSKII